MFAEILKAFLFLRTASALHVGRQQPDSAAFCFPKPPGDQIQGMLDFMPDTNLSISPSDALAEALQTSFAEKSALCDASYGVTVPLYGVGASLSGLLKPFTQAWNSHQLINSPRVGGFNFSVFGMKPILSPSCGDRSDLPTQNADTVARIMHIQEKIPREFAEQGNFWWSSQQWAFLLRPDEKLASGLEELKATLDWEASKPILAMHVRHGDSCSQVETQRKARDCEGLEEYMKHARRLLDKYNYKSIFLATDDPEVIQEATQKYPQYNWLYRSGVEAVKLPDGMIFEYGVRAGLINYEKAVRDYLNDLFLLADADGFVGKFTSNLGRLALSLHYGQKRCLSPFISMDSYWCTDFMEMSGYNPYRNAHFLC